MNSTTTSTTTSTNNDDDTPQKFFEYDERKQHHSEDGLLYIFDSFNEYSKDFCDRRLSRAARKLLKKHFLRAQQQKYTTVLEEDKSEFEITSQIDVWSLLDDMIGKTDVTKCPLIPSKDIFRHDEEHTSQIRPLSSQHQLNWAYPTYTIQQRRKKVSNNPQYTTTSNWFQCGYCGKVFTSQYYFDIHMHTHHNHHPHPQLSNIIEDNNNNNGMICPAVDWCKVVGLANCHEQALLDEPYYGRGSGGWGDDRKFVEHKWRKEAHSIKCDLSTIKQDCIVILSTSCSVGLAKEICDGLECPTHHIWQSISDSILSVYLPEHYYDTWIDEAKHHKGFTILVFILVFGCVLYFSEIDFGGLFALFPDTTTTRRNKNKKELRQQRPGSRLLRKNSQSGSRLPFNQRNRILRSKGSKIH